MPWAYGVAATEKGRGLEFCREVSALILGWQRDRLGSRKAFAASRAGLQLSELKATITAQIEKVRGAIG